MIRQSTIQIIFLIIPILYIVNDFHEFHMDFLKDKENTLILGKFISDKEIVFEVVRSEFKEVKPEFESSFNEYEDYTPN